MTVERWTMAASLESPGHARRLVRAYAARHGAGADVLAALALCVTEAVSNVVVHAYRALDEPGEVEVEAHKPDGYLCLYVRDQGSGLAPRVDSPGLGLGLGIISSSASAFEVRTLATGGTEIVMRFDLSDSPAPVGSHGSAVKRT